MALGLSIYAGEDLPDLNEGGEPTQPPQVVEKPKLPAKVTPLPGADERPARNEWLTDAQLRFVQKLIAETGTATRISCWPTSGSRRWTPSPRLRPTA